jgi:cobalt-zinc-cadmium efflux system outer membrane protein
VRENVDQAVCDAAAHPVDIQPQTPVDESLPMPRRQAMSDGVETGQADPAVFPAAMQEPGLSRPPDAGQRQTFVDRFKIPPGLPGAGAPPIPDLPRYDKENPKPREEAVLRLYPPLPALGPEPQPAPGLYGHPMTLAELQAVARAKSPLIAQAMARVEASEGAAIQAGAYPNPTLGYQSDTAGTSGTAGFQGAFFEQLIKTAGKLKLAQAAALMDVYNARLDFRKAQADVATQVRTNYFQLLVARENVRVSRALITLTDQVYGIQVDQLKVGFVAGYEPMQLRVLALQARGALIAARNSYLANWKQLAATLGLPGLPLTEVGGRVDMPLPVYRYDRIQGHVLNNHTDVLEAYNNIQKARYNLRLAEVTPIPDAMLHVAVEKDFSMPPFAVTHSVQLGFPVPLLDQNRGGIRQAQGLLRVNIDEPHRVRDDLVNRLSDAFQRYETNRALLDYYRTQILPDQVRAYRSVFVRHNEQPEQATFGDIVSAQQTLATAVTTYVTTLGAVWQAVTDIAGLLQTNDLFQVGGEVVESECPAPVPDLAPPAALPCEHPCGPQPDAAWKGADPSWPPATGANDELLDLPLRKKPAPPAKPPAPAEKSPAPADSRRPVPLRQLVSEEHRTEPRPVRATPDPADCSPWAYFIPPSAPPRDDPRRPRY